MSFAGGMNSQLAPRMLPSGQYVSSMNTINRGGVVQTRPGYKTLFQLPPGPIQGSKLFTPTNGPAHIVVAVAGYIYVSASPFLEYTRLPGIRFQPGARRVYFAKAERSSHRIAGRIFLTEPHSVLMMQDGRSRPAYWDGSTARQLDPTKGETPIGTVMAWSGDRLWVVRGSQLTAGDIADPLSFTETQYLAEGLSFRLPADGTAIAEAPASDDAQLLVFTHETTSVFQSSIRDRNAWKETPGFQRVLFPNSGCVSDLSVASQFGLLWWYSASGLVALDSAFASKQSSKMVHLDNEMAASKRGLGPLFERVSIVAHENFLLVSVPSGDASNRHTWVLDQSVADSLKGSAAPVWSSYWTGTRPVSWATGVIDGRARTFHVSRDYDHSARVWEVFRDSRTDNGTPITCSLETRAYTYNSPQLKSFRHAELQLSHLEGTVDVSVSYAGIRGDFEPVAEFRLEATQGAGLTADDRAQLRTVRTPEARDRSCGCGDDPESTLHRSVDRGHSLLIVWSGQLGVQTVQLFADIFQEKSHGTPTVNESPGAGVPRKLKLPTCEYTHEASYTHVENVDAQATFSGGTMWSMSEADLSFTEEDEGRVLYLDSGDAVTVVDVLTPTSATVDRADLAGLKVVEKWQTEATRTVTAISRVSLLDAEQRAKSGAQLLARSAAIAGRVAHDRYATSPYVTTPVMPEDGIIYLP